LIDCIKIDVNLRPRQLGEQTTRGIAMTDRAMTNSAKTNSAKANSATTNRPAVFASEVAPRAKTTNYPEPFAARVNGRIKRQLGELFGLGNFGVNLTRLTPGAASSLHHRHSRQDEFIYVIEGEATLLTDHGETTLRPGMVAGFPAGGTAHHLENRGDRDCVILEIGDRTPGDEVIYPADDIQAVLGEEGRWYFAHKDGTAY
jgi:uncharacterized cupin superfamily protein